MAGEGKEKKRKAITEATSTNTPEKKHKKSKNKKENAEGASQSKPIESTAASQARVEAPNGPPTKEGSPTQHAPGRKRAVDFLSDDDDSSLGGAKLPNKASEEPGKETDRPSKKSKKQKKAEKLSGTPASNTNKVERTETADMGGQAGKTVKKAVRFTEDGKGNRQATVAKTTVEPAPKKKQRGPTVPDVMADRFTKLISQDSSEWDLDGKKKKQMKVSADAAIEDSAHKPNGDTQGATISEGAKDVTSTVLQVKAQGLDGETERSSQQQEEDFAPELLNGFDNDSPDEKEDEGLDGEAQSFTLPNYKRTNKKLRKVAEKGNKEGPGTVYVGRIPHGFYEHQMRAYFSQFGNVTKLRISRNRKTGASKHFAFVQFDSVEVAKIVAQTMDNYLMFGHILKCKFAPEETLHPDVWKGANRRYRKIPHNKIEGKWLDSPKTKEYWAAKTENEQQKREAKAGKLKELGYEIELPKMTSVEDVRPQMKTDTADESAPTHGTAADDAVSAEPSSKKAKKDKAKDKTKENTENNAAPNVPSNLSLNSHSSEATAQAAANVLNDLPTSQRKVAKKEKHKKEKKAQTKTSTTNGDAAADVSVDADADDTFEGFSTAATATAKSSPSQSQKKDGDGLTGKERKQREKRKKRVEKRKEKRLKETGNPNPNGAAKVMATKVKT